MSQEPEPPQTSAPIPYATREDTGLAAAYRLVGWFYLATAVVSVLSTAVVAIYITTRAGATSWSSVATYGMQLAPRLLSIVGAVAMIRTRGWGALVVAGVYAIAVLLNMGISVFQFQQIRSATPPWFVFSNVVSSSLNSAVMALFPLGLWLICRNKGVLR